MRSVAPNESGEHRLTGGFGFLRSLHHTVESGNIESEGLLNEDVLPCRDGCFELHWAEVWRSGEQNNIHSTVDHLLIGIETNKLTFSSVGIDTARKLLGNPFNLFHAFFDDITDSPEHSIRVSFQDIRDGTSAATTKPYNAYFVL